MVLNIQGDLSELGVEGEIYVSRKSCTDYRCG